MLSKILLLCTFFELGDFVQIEEFQNQKFRRSNNTYNPILKHLTLMSIIDQLNMKTKKVVVMCFLKVNFLDLYNVGVHDKFNN